MPKSHLNPSVFSVSSVVNAVYPTELDAARGLIAAGAFEMADPIPYIAFALGFRELSMRLDPLDLPRMPLKVHDLDEPRVTEVVANDRQRR